MYIIACSITEVMEHTPKIKKYIHTHTYINIHIHKHIHTYIHTYTHIHTYIHTYQVKIAEDAADPVSRTYIQLPS